MSSFVKVMPPASVENKSSTLGSGYCSSLEALLAVSLQSPHILHLQSGFRTGTIGAAHLEDFTGLTIPKFSSRCNSFSTISFNKYSNGLALQNLGTTDGSM